MLAHIDSRLTPITQGTRPTSKAREHVQRDASFSSGKPRRRSTKIKTGRIGLVWSLGAHYVAASESDRPHPSSEINDTDALAQRTMTKPLNSVPAAPRPFACSCSTRLTSTPNNNTRPFGGPTGGTTSRISRRAPFDVYLYRKSILRHLSTLYSPQRPKFPDAAMLKLVRLQNGAVYDGRTLLSTADWDVLVEGLFNAIMGLNVSRASQIFRPNLSSTCHERPAGGARRWDGLVVVGLPLNPPNIYVYQNLGFVNKPSNYNATTFLPPRRSSQFANLTHGLAVVFVVSFRRTVPLWLAFTWNPLFLTETTPYLSVTTASKM
ncbi:hypothetical protein B0H16DRAFT_1711017 [Mycena metata]|uniref:Uncharacterized protein n=1 Tax=Mycena metata TaxID=1033252 RepID=A0AAD7K9I4_9AGAR|nr:hypothetical protein B0H16DRAFT_1711017 [Mycena metata]